MNDLESRKRLLVAESELNRVQLIQDIDSWVAGVRAVVDQAGHLPAIASSAMALVGNLLAKRHSEATGIAGWSTWIGGLIKGVGVFSSLWAAFRQRRP